MKFQRVMVDAAAQIGRFDPSRIGVIRNIYSRHNVRAAAATACAGGDGVEVHRPQSKAELAQVLELLARRDVTTIVLDGGDGTVRDVLTLGLDVFGDAMPEIALAPSGKTNALAHDLGIARRRPLDAALAAVEGGRRVVKRGISILREEDCARYRGFLFGTGAFVRATTLAQGAHRLGAFNGVAVGLSLASVVMHTLFGSDDGEWRSGDRLQISRNGSPPVSEDVYALFLTTLTRLPLGMAPFGRIEGGLHSLLIEAPPRRIVRSLLPLLRGISEDELADAGYHRRDHDYVRLATPSPFILDGERFVGGALQIRRGPPITFVV
jgi:diacylglycerol kinase (ATP)